MHWENTGSNRDYFECNDVFLHTSSHDALIVGGCVGVGFLLYGFYKTDSEIEKKFLES